MEITQKTITTALAQPCRVTKIDAKRYYAVQKRNEKDWPHLCNHCGCGLTSTDWQSGYCTNCKKELR